MEDLYLLVANGVRSNMGPYTLFGPNTIRATAIVAARSSSSASGIPAIAVSGLARKFCTITSCTCPCARAAPRIANSA